MESNESPSETPENGHESESAPRAPRSGSRGRRESGSSSERVAALRAAQAEVIRPEKTPIAIGVASGAAVLGAIIWALIISQMDLEIGYVAWGVGGLVGFAAVVVGGRGTLVAGLCGALALFAIVGGKYLGFEWSIEKAIEKNLGTSFNQQLYEIDQSWAEDVAGLDLSNRESVVTYLEENGWNTDDSPSLSKMEIDDFIEFEAPILAKLHQSKQTFEEWRASRLEQIKAQIDKTQMLIDSLEPIDLLFAGLGIVTAVGLVIRKTQDDEAAARRAVLREHRTD
ncbi:MAG: hypothetical protein AAF196_14070 [Planctomycetota bacterium]